MGRHKYKLKGANLPDDLWEEFKEECKLRNTTVVKALTEAIKLWMSK